MHHLEVRRGLPWLRTRNILRDISRHQSLAEKLTECTSPHRTRCRERDGRRSSTDIIIITTTTAIIIIILLISRVCTDRSPARNLEDRAVHRFVLWPGHGVCCREMAGILAWFWNERFWLPHNVTWADLKNTDEATFPQAEDLYLACPLAFCIFMIRLIFERWVWAHAFGVAVDPLYVGGWCSTAAVHVFHSLS